MRSICLVCRDVCWSSTVECCPKCEGALKIEDRFLPVYRRFLFDDPIARNPPMPIARPEDEFGDDPYSFMRRWRAESYEAAVRILEDAA